MFSYCVSIIDIDIIVSRLIISANSGIEGDAGSPKDMTQLRYDLRRSFADANLTLMILMATLVVFENSPRCKS